MMLQVRNCERLQSPQKAEVGLDVSLPERWSTQIPSLHLSSLSLRAKNKKQPGTGQVQNRKKKTGTGQPMGKKSKGKKWMCVYYLLALLLNGNFSFVLIVLIRAPGTGEVRGMDEPLCWSLVGDLEANN